MTTVSLFCGGTISSCDDGAVPVDRTPLVEASGATGAPPWSPMNGLGHSPGRTRTPTAPVIAGLVGFAAGVGVVLGAAAGGDPGAPQGRAALAPAPPGAAGGP